MDILTSTELVMRISALFFFNIFCIIGIILIIFIFTTVSRLSEKAEEFIDESREVLDNGSKFVDRLLDFLLLFKNKEKKNIFSKFFRLFK